MDISILFGTYNRFELLQKAVASLRRATGNMSYELVVVDGGSTDGTLAWLRDQPDVVLVEQGELLGCTKAFNEGFQHCRGASVCVFNDDAEIVATEGYSALVAAQQMLFSDPTIGSVALRHNHRVKKGSRTNVQYVIGKMYVNLGLTRMDVCKKVETICGGFFHPIYRTYAADCEHSCWVWKLGYQVVGLHDPEYHVQHHAPGDDLRESNRDYLSIDATIFYQRWQQGMLEPGVTPNVDAETLARFNAISRA